MDNAKKNCTITYPMISVAKLLKIFKLKNFYLKITKNFNKEEIGNKRPIQ